jgi:hypothetical protein
VRETCRQDQAYLGCRLQLQTPSLTNFSSCFLSSLAALQADFSTAMPNPPHQIPSSLRLTVDIPQNPDSRRSATISKPNPPAQIDNPRISNGVPNRGCRLAGMELSNQSGIPLIKIQVAWPNQAPPNLRGDCLISSNLESLPALWIRCGSRGG